MFLVICTMRTSSGKLRSATANKRSEDCFNERVSWLLVKFAARARSRAVGLLLLEANVDITYRRPKGFNSNFFNKFIAAVL